MKFTRRQLLQGTLSAVVAGSQLTPSRWAIAEQKPRTLKFLVKDQFQAPVDNVQAVLNSAAQEIWRHCPELNFTAMDGFQIYRHDKYPITHYQQEEKRIVIGLATGGLYWAQYSFQFAHEFCHAIVGHTRPEQQRWLGAKNRNHWLEESFCETASLFALRAMAKTWETAPPYGNWKGYSKSLANYATDRIAEAEKLLPKNAKFSEWLLEQLPHLEKESTDRAKNLVVAARLLPLFEADPGGWETMASLKATANEIDKPLLEQLRDWEMHTSEKLRPFPAMVRRLLLDA